MNIVEAANAEYYWRGMDIPAEVKVLLSACRTAFMKGAEWKRCNVLTTLRELREQYANDVKSAKDEQDYVYAQGKKDALIILETLLNDTED